MAMTKKAKALATAVNRDKLYSIDEAIGLVKSLATAKFDETIEVSLNLGVDPRHADQMVRGVVTLPKGTGKTVRVGVFARGAKADEAKAAGADVVGAEDLLELVNRVLDFARADAGTLALESVPFEVEPILQAASERLRLGVAGRPVSWHVGTVAEVPAELVGDGRRIRELLLAQEACLAER